MKNLSQPDNNEATLTLPSLPRVQYSQMQLWTSCATSLISIHGFIVKLMTRPSFIFERCYSDFDSLLNRGVYVHSDLSV